MFRSKYYFRKITLLLIDLILLFGALYIALKIRYWMTGNVRYCFEGHYEQFAVVFLFWLLVFYLLDLYDLRKIKSLSFVFSNLLTGILLNYIISVIIFYFISMSISPRLLLVLIGVLSLVLIGLWRYAWNKLFRPAIKSKVLLVGDDINKIEKLDELIHPSELEYEVVGFVNLGQAQAGFDSKIPLLGSVGDLEKLISEHGINEVVTFFDYHKYSSVTDKLAEILYAGIIVVDLPRFYEQATGKVPVEYIDQTWFLSHIHAGKYGFENLKQIIDGVAAFWMLILFLPFSPLVALAIKLNSRGKIIYSQTRIGQHGKPFTLYKFRTMTQDAEKDSGAVWAKENDPRITRVGGFLRKTRLDEIPQLINVLKGQMSLVGPRPERPEFVAQLKEQIPFYTRRHLVKPGLTGWAQVKYRYGNTTEDTLEKLQHDLFYIKNRSMLLYMMILLRTVRIVLSREGM